MKIKRILSVLCATVMIVTIVASLFIANLDYQQSIEIDDKLGAAMALGIWLTLTIPVLACEYEVFHTVSYFITEKQNRKTYKSVFNLLSAIVSVIALISLLMLLFNIRWDSVIILLSMIGLYIIIKFVHLIYMCRECGNQPDNSSKEENDI